MSPAPRPPTPQQQAVLDRIHAQRERQRTRRDMLRVARATAPAQGRVNPQDPLLTRLLSFARLHPALVAVVLAAVAAAGPNRVMRWAGVLLPAILRMRRG